MFMKFKQSATVVFLDPQRSIELGEKGEKIRLILSPSLYWVKKTKLPVKSVREARTLLESFFEDSLPKGAYSYEVYKKENDFFLFAYEDKKILELIAQKGLSLSNISSIHFAQSEFDASEDAFTVNESEVMYVKDGVVLLTPSSWVQEAKELDLKDIKLSKHRIRLQQFGHIVDKKSLYTIAFIALAFIFVLGGELFITASKIAKTEKAKDALFSKYKLQSTMFQNRSTQSKYSKMYKRGEKLRLIISYFLNMKLQGEQKISLIEYRNRLFSVTISGVSEGNERKILAQLDNKKVKYTPSFNKESMKVEIKI